VTEQFATKQDLADAVAPLASKQDLAALRVEFKSDLAETEHRITDKLTEAIRDSQTEVLRAFYDWARPIGVRLSRVDEVASRLSWIEERLTALERRKLPS